MKKLNYKHTIAACFIAYMVQAIVCNFAPLLFVTWNKEFNISIPQLTTIITLTFLIQIIVDFIAAKTCDKIGYKNSLIISHAFSAVGFLLLAVLPYTLSNTYLGIVISVLIYSVGSGLLEVLISPVVESCPTDNKTGAMSLLHSFYCWGTVFVIGVSTAFFALFGRDSWKTLSLIWAAFSLLNGIFFIFVPIKEIDNNHEKPQGIISLFKTKGFFAMVIIMTCAGASELAMSQWASTFAEASLNISKTVGDLAGPMAFAILMGIGRVGFSRISSKIKIENFIAFSAVLCIISYLLASLSPIPIISLIGCALCGLAISAMWPGTISLSTKIIASPSTAMFAMLALAGDLGCTYGPSLIGYITNSLNGDLKKGLIFSIIFPIIILITLTILKISNKKSS